MARMRESILRWGNKYDGPNNYKNNRRGGAEDALWDENELVDHRRAGSKKNKPRKRKGCSENEGKAHVYVWATLAEIYNEYDYRWYSEREGRICCGCGKRGNGLRKKQ
jgi:hypothetical protein